jgi:hypothetical protein
MIAIAEPAPAGSEITLYEPTPAALFRARWLEIQTSFVDEPRQSVEQADSLVAEVMDELTRTFADERSEVEPHLVRGEEISTEDLRMALQRYRALFDRLLSI